MERVVYGLRLCSLTYLLTFCFAGQNSGSQQYPALVFLRAAHETLICTASLSEQRLPGKNYGSKLPASTSLNGTATGCVACTFHFGLANSVILTNLN